MKFHFACQVKYLKIVAIYPVFNVMISGLYNARTQDRNHSFMIDFTGYFIHVGLDPALSR